MKLLKTLVFLDIIISIFTPLLFSQSNSQTDDQNTIISKFLKFKIQILLPEEIERTTDYNSVILGEDLYVLPTNLRDKTSGNLFLFKYSLNSNSIDTILIPIKLKYIYGFAMNDSFLVISSGMDLHIFSTKYSKTNEISFIFLDDESFDIYIRQKDLFLKDSLIIISDCNLSSQRLELETQNATYIYSIPENEIIAKHFFQNPKGLPMLWFQPKKVNTVSSKYILLSDLSEYNLKLFNYNFDTISTKSNKFAEGNLINDSSTISLFNSIDLWEPKDGIDMLRKFTGGINLIHNVNFINDSIFFVMRSLPLGGEYNYIPEYDLWSVRNGVIELISSNLRNPERGDVTYPNHPSVGNVYDVENGFLIINSQIPVLLKNDTNLSDLKNITEEYFEKNENVRLSIFIYAFVF